MVNELIGASVTVAAYGQRMYQTFGLAANVSWTVDQVELKVRKVGAPADGCAWGSIWDAAGAPGTLIEQQDVAGGSIGTAEAWVAWNFLNLQQVNYGTTYGLVVERTGADPDNYYEVWLDPDGGYSRGSLKLHDGARIRRWLTICSSGCWGRRIRRRRWRVVHDTDTELFGAIVEVPSGVLSWQYRDGEETGQAVAEALLAAGVSGGFRLLAQTTPARWVRIYGEDSGTNALCVGR